MSSSEDPNFLLVAAPLSLRLPVVPQLRLATSKAWRAELAQRAAPRVDLSAAAGVRSDRVTDETLHAAVARAQGRLEVLDVRGCASLSAAALVAVLDANAATLRELRTGDAPQHTTLASLLNASLPCDQLVQLLTRAPLLHKLDVKLACGVAEAVALVQTLLQRAGSTAYCVVKAAVEVDLVPYAPGGDVVDLALAARARARAQVGHRPPPWHAPFAATVRAAVDVVSLEFPGLFVETPALVRALSELPRLRRVELVLPADAFDGRGGVQRYPLAEELGALIAADVATLQQFSLSTQRVLDVANLVPLAAALPLNSHLEVLQFCGVPGADAAADVALAEFARDVLLPAVTANTGLRELRIATERPLPELRQAEALVQQRAQQPSA